MVRVHVLLSGIVRPVAGFPKSINWGEKEPAHVTCKTCFDDDAEGKYASLF